MKIPKNFNCSKYAPSRKMTSFKMSTLFQRPNKQPDSNVQMHVWSATGPKKMIYQGNMAYIYSLLAFTKSICALLTMIKP